MKQLNFRLSRAARLLAGLTLLTGVWVPPTDGPPAPAAQPPPDPRSPSAIIHVDRGDDAGGSAWNCTAATNDCTLRGAILKANASGIVNSIYFTSTVTVVTPVTPLPTITEDGTWIFGVAGVPKVDALVVSGGDVFTIDADNTLISGLSIVNGPSSGGWADIRVIGGTGNIISQNFLGGPPNAAATGSSSPQAPGGGCTPTGVVDNSVYGVVVTGTVGASGTFSGTYIIGNTIICHGGHGVAVFGSDYVYVGETQGGGSLGNYIGVTAQGANWGNGGSGVAFLAQGTNGVRLGVIRDNTIANNAGHGVWLAGTGTANTGSTFSNIVRGNRIGLDANGPKGNGGHGVALSLGAYLNQIGGVTAAERNVISSNDSNGVWISASNANGVLGNYVGTDLTGSGTTFGNGLHGISIVSGNANVIGGYLPVFTLITAPNVIARNTGHGIGLLGPSTANTLIVGNYIGTDATGALDRGNSLGGIAIQNTVTGVITGNIVSGNGTHGISLFNSSSITITANRVGTNAAGTAALGNGQSGISLGGGSTDNLVGGTRGGARNVLSGNDACGVEITFSAANDISGNFIGLNLAGNAAIPNQGAGVCLWDADDNEIGVAGGPLAQYIAGNLGEGIRLENGSSDNLVWLQNYIGVASDGTTPLGNGLEGVLIDGGSDNKVFALIVANNGGAGLAVTSNSSARNMLIANTIRDNNGLPVDLGNNGHTPNDAGDGDTGPNGLLNYPKITAWSSSTITGTTCINCGVRIYLALGDPTTPGGGGTVFSSTSADAGGNWSASLFGHEAWEVTLQTISVAQATSELSPRGPGRLYLPLILK